ncbi:sterol desaturase family protein [Loktanella agnita]|uniref:sterol desaturase family protein n=1 Tax=Loktanella agnita TaxID=287097 RepID=UPI003988EEED
MTAIAFPILLMLALVLAEMVIINRQGRIEMDWHDVAFNLNSGHLMVWLFRGLELAVFGLVAEHASFDVVGNWHPVAVWVLAVIGWDFCFYWLHRLHHKFAILWAVHVVHHEGEHFNLSLAMRNSWYSSLASIPFFIPLALLGVPLEMFITVSVLHYGIQLMNHSALTPHLGVLERILVTPAHHRIHHVADRAWSDSNYAGSFVIWDKLFGTYRPDLPEGDFDYGVKGASPSRNPAIASNNPVLRYVFRWKVGTVKPQPRYRAQGPMVFAGTILLFCLVTGYVWIYGYGYTDLGYSQLTSFSLLAFGAIALGGISEGRHWALYGWVALSVLLVADALSGGAGYVWLLTCCVLTLHSVSLLMGFGREPA